MPSTGSWILVPTPGDVPVVSLLTAGADVFALGSRAEGASVILKKRGSRFAAVAEHPARFDRLCSVPSGCFIALGPEASACFDGTRWTDHPLPERVEGLRRIWECSTSELYAVARQQLLFFDGMAWRKVEVAGAQGQSFAWADGDGGSDCGGWLVGQDAAGSVFATGSKQSWAIASRCPDPALEVVRVFGREHALAMGRGRWELEDGSWKEQAASSPRGRPLFAEHSRGRIVLGYLRPEERVAEVHCCCTVAAIPLEGVQGELGDISLSPLPTGHLLLKDGAGRVLQSRAPILCPPA
ncbi:MAG: hypothetical protein ACOX6T_07805 [Myxococcales bacterium]|jgi:hypothetical protein